MNTKQILFIFILFLLALVVIALPIWIDGALPVMKNGIDSAVETSESLWSAIKFISVRLYENIMGLLDKYVFGS